MSEKRLWQYLRDGMKGMDIILQRHEDRYSNDIADVSFTIGNINGWIELKHAAKRPRRYVGGKITYGHPLTNGQALWLRHRPHTFVLAQVERDYALHRCADFDSWTGLIDAVNYRTCTCMATSGSIDWLWLHNELIRR